MTSATNEKKAPKNSGKNQVSEEVAPDTNAMAVKPSSITPITAQIILMARLNSALPVVWECFAEKMRAAKIRYKAARFPPRPPKLAQNLPQDRFMPHNMPQPLANSLISLGG